MTNELPTLWELLNWAAAPKWHGILIVGLAEVALGGTLSVAIFRATTPRARAARASRALAVRRPGWPPGARRACR